MRDRFCFLLMFAVCGIVHSGYSENGATMLGFGATSAAEQRAIDVSAEHGLVDASPEETPYDEVRFFTHTESRQQKKSERRRGKRQRAHSERDPCERTRKRRGKRCGDCTGRQEDTVRGVVEKSIDGDCGEPSGSSRSGQPQQARRFAGHAEEGQQRIRTRCDETTLNQRERRWPKASWQKRPPRKGAQRRAEGIRHEQPQCFRPGTLELRGDIRHADARDEKDHERDAGEQDCRTNR